MELSLAAWAVIIPYGMLASSLGTLVGLGGGAFVVPMLVLVFGVPLKMAVVAVTFSLFPSALLSTIFNIRRKNIDYFAGISLEIPTIFGAILGAYLTKILPVRPMEILFGFFLFYIGARLLRKREPSQDGLLLQINKIPPVFHRTQAGHSYSMGIPALGIFGLISGLIAGLFGVGGGIVKTPVMLRVFKMPMKRATSTSIFMIMFTSATATFSHWKMGSMNWAVALPIGASFFCGSFIANYWGNKLKSTFLEKLLGYLVIAAAFAVLIHVWGF